MTRNSPQQQTTGGLGQALAGTQKWSASRNDFVMDAYAYPGVMLTDSFENATGTWFGLGASGANTGLVNPSSTTTANTGSKSLQVTGNTSSRYVAVRKFDLTPKKKLGFDIFFCYDSPVNVRYIHFETRWRDVDHGLDHIAGLQYDTFNKRWQYLGNTASSASGSWTILPNGSTTMASGAGDWHRVYFDVDWANGNYDEFVSGQVGLTGTTALSFGSPTAVLTVPELVEEQRVELRLGVETTASGAGNAWFDDVTVLEVD